MGYGDQLMGTGLARGAKARGKRMAFGDGRIRWDRQSEEIYRGNPNIAPPGSERDGDLEWKRFFKGSRLYNRDDKVRKRWAWNTAFRPTPGELYFTPTEIQAGLRFGEGFVLIEPHVEDWKGSAPNKDWGQARYQAVADRLTADGYRLLQFRYPKAGPLLHGVEAASTKSFRDACAVLANAAAYVGPEGGLHHAAAAVGVRGVVIFGGFIPPAVTGYDIHINLTGGAEACGRYTPCNHCRAALDAISVDEVHLAVRSLL